MPAVTLKAHFDGERILLDEPFEIAPNSALMVTILAPPDADDSAASWLSAGTSALSRAFGDAEPEYTSDDVKR